MAAARTGESVCQSGGCVGSVGRAFAHTRCLRACFRRWSFVVEPARPSRTARSDVGSGTHLRRQLPSAPCAAVAGRVASRLESPSPTGHCFWLGVEPQRTQNGRTLRPVQSGPNQNSRHQNGCNYASTRAARPPGPSFMATPWSQATPVTPEEGSAIATLPRSHRAMTTSREHAG